MAAVERILREYRHTARRRHFCDQCFHDILPGELYEGTVGVLDRHRLMVMKEHVQCPFDPDEDEKYYRSLSEEHDEDIPLPAAA